MRTPLRLDRFQHAPTAMAAAACFEEIDPIADPLIGDARRGLRRPLTFEARSLLTS
jgi:hypothetical protein